MSTATQAVDPKAFKLPLQAGSSSEPRVVATFPLSSMQQSLWFVEQLFPGTSAYNLAEAWRLRGSLDRELLEKGITALIQRHESLRTVFAEQNGIPMQVVLEPERFRLETSNLPEPDLIETLQKAVREPFELRTRPLFRARLFRVANEDHVLLISMPHILSDEGSFQILARDLAQLYAAGLKNSAPVLPELTVQYGDFAAWQKNNLELPQIKSSLEFWKGRLQLPLPSVPLPADLKSASSCFLQGRTIFAQLARQQLETLKIFSQEQNATLFMTLVAGFQTLLHKYSRQTDLLIGTPLGGRGNVETEDVIGLFVKTLPLRTDLSDDPTFMTLLDRVRESVVASYAHQSVPLDKLIEVVQPERDRNRHPLFQVVLGLQPALQNPWSATNLTATRIELDNGGSKFDWTLLATETSDGLLLRSEFSTQKYSVDLMEQVLRHFIAILSTIPAQRDVRVSSFKFLSAAERESLLYGPVSKSARELPAGTEIPASATIQQLFEAQAQRAPDAVALVLENNRWTYGELETRANQLANLLIEKGVGPEVPVALCLERSFEMVAAILAVLKAGGSYVPIEPTLPGDRREFMIRDSAARVLLTTSKHSPNLGETGLPVVCLDQELHRLAASPSTAPWTRSGPENAAYVIYTSGSTGQPKGVVVTHRNVTRLFDQTRHWFGFTDQDVWTLFHSYSFDFSVWEIWGALLFGGKLVIVPYVVSRSPEDFLQLLEREGVTVLNQTPSAFRQLIWAEGSVVPAPKLNLRYVICGGEALELQSLKPWFCRHGDGRPEVINMYGITETTVHVTFRVIREEDIQKNAGSVIGVPIPDLQLYVLDENLEPVPIGVAGEICVGGEGVARGYLNRPELTAARFVPDGFSKRAGARLYRSGDLARRTFDGELEYLGRMDQQVKIRGFRIELGEIESAINSHPTIRESLVLTEETRTGDKRLIAYVVPRNGKESFSEAVIRNDLHGKLPEYMLPSAFIALEGFPLTNNGKVDRRALPSPAMVQVPNANSRSPGTRTERLVYEIWSELLEARSIGIDDNFFHLGGHSLLATQAMARLASMLGLDLSIRELFEFPTIAALANYIDTQGAKQVSTGPSLRSSLQPSEAEALLNRIEELSDQEVERLLAEESQQALSS